MADFDLAVIGGGINGVGVARDAAGRGIRVLLAEQNDLGAGTSSASTKLIHGGLADVARGSLRRVGEGLAEREVLLGMAPHLVRPLRFVLPHHEALRPAWQLRLGLFVYDRLSGRTFLPGAEPVDLTHGEIGVPLKRQFKQGFEYSDCSVDDSRLVVLNALDAAERGAVIRPRTRVVRADRDGRIWRLALGARGSREVVTARVLVNAAGPWIGEVMERVLRLDSTDRLRFVKGSHIVVRRLFDHDRAYSLQSGDDRVLFVIPYERDFTLIGSTELAYDGHPGALAASADEITRLCRAASAYLREPVEPRDVVWAFAGVRPAFGVSARRIGGARRDPALALDAPPHGAPLLTVHGGRITTYRRLAEAVLAVLARHLVAAPPWTDRVPLPGGDFPCDGIEALVSRARGLWPFLGEDEARRLVSAYGTRLDRVLGKATSRDELGPRFGGELTAAEVRYLMRHEWAETPDDVLWRRSKLGLRIGPDGQAALATFMADTAGHSAAAE